MGTMKKILFCFILVVGICCIISSVFLSSTSIFGLSNLCKAAEPASEAVRSVINQLLRKEYPRKNDRQKLILFGSSWYPRLGSKYPYLEETSKVCPKCIFTQDLKFFSVSDAVVFHGNSLADKPYNISRPRHQMWVWMYDESPLNTWGSLERLKNYKNLFNWTMTFNTNSDIFWPYGRVVLISQTPRPSFDEKWAFLPSDTTQANEIYSDALLIPPSLEELRTRLPIAWVSSHCQTHSAREQLVAELRNYIMVDTYGACGNYSCETPRWLAQNESLTGNPGIDCRLMVSQHYKFYLSFENSLCKDYVTEKFFDALLTQMVPVVYGSANYEAFAPEKSYINVADFKDVKSLADYLIHLDQNPEEYLKYFEWKKYYWVQNNGWVIGYCAICEKLWNPGPSRQPYHDLKKWFETGSDSKVTRPSYCISTSEYRALQNRSELNYNLTAHQ